MTRRLLWIVALFLLIFPQMLTAQTPAPATIDFSGTIDANPAGTLIVNGRVVDIQNAQMNGLLLAPGVTVHIQGEFAPDGTLIARQLEVIPVGLIPGLVELRGVITEQTATTLRLDDQLIDLSGARLVGSIVVGQPVQVFARASRTNLWSARVVLGAASDADLAPAATPEVVVVSPAATPEVAPPAETPIVVQPVSTLEVVPPADSPVVVSPITTPEVSDDFRIEGRLEAVGSNAVIVDGQTYDISSARIEDPLTVGTFVRMEVRVIGGRFVVERIRTED